MKEPYKINYMDVEIPSTTLEATMQFFGDAFGGH